MKMFAVAAALTGMPVATSDRVEAQTARHHAGRAGVNARIAVRYAREPGG